MKMGKKIDTFIYLLILSTLCRVSFAQELEKILDIKLPDVSYKRINVEQNSFAEWLRNLPIKPKDSPVFDYKGRIHKSAKDTTIGKVIAWDIKDKYMEQCMDILVRFYAEYIWKIQNTSILSLPLPGGKWIYWNDWKDGIRPVFKGINVELKKTASPDSSRSIFEKYLRTIFNVSHTQQFYHAYLMLNPDQIKIGDFIVKKGTKSHAVMIVDLAENKEGDLIALIGHGDTPACEFHLLAYSRNQIWFPVDSSINQFPLPIKRMMTWDGLRRFQMRKLGINNTF
jgi:hypothetical protein